MDPITLGIAAATMYAAKLWDRISERSADSLIDQAAPLRRHIAELLEGDSATALTAVEHTPDSAIAVNALAKRIADAVPRRPSVAAALAGYVESQQNIGQLGVSARVSVSDRAHVERIYQASRDQTINESPGS